MKPKTPKPYQFTKPLKQTPGKGNDPVTKALKFFFGDETKPSRKKTGPKPRAVRPRDSKPAPMPGIKGTDGKRPLPLIGGGRGLTPVPMPRINPGPRTRKPAAPAGPKTKSPGVVIKPRAKKKY